MKELVFAPDFTSHAEYRSLIAKKESVEYFIKKGGSVTLALLDHKTIVGFGVLDYPDEKERWAKLGKKIIMELKAVEVLREYRNHGVARHLLSHLFFDPQLEQKIIYLTAYSWTWNLDYSGLSAQSYRNMLISLYTGLEFIEYPTNEPNICLRPENIFMVRVGKKVNQTIREKFRWLCYGITEDEVFAP